MSNYNPYGYPYGTPNFNYQNQAPQPQQNLYAIVNGLEGAKNYPIAINQTMLLMDSNQPVAYKKSSNGLGQSTIECYKLVQISEQEARGETSGQPQVEFALKSDLDALYKKIDELSKKQKKETKVEGEQNNA